MTENNLIDRYVHAVGNLLASKEREDIQMELRSALQDMLEERGLNPDDPEHEDGIAEMLKEFGPPLEIANSYRPQRYLIGPRYFPIYVQVIKIVAAVIVGALTLASLIGGLEGQGFFEQFGNLLGMYLSGLWGSLGFITFIFFVLERTGVADEEIEAELSKGWDPKDLPAIEDRDRISHIELVFELLFIMAFLVILNSAFGVVGTASDFVRRWDFLTDVINALRPFVPWLVTLLGIELGLKFTVLIKGAWQRWSRGLEFALSVGNTIILSLLYAAAPYSDTLWLNTGMRVIVIVALLITVGVGLGQLYRLIWPQRQPPWAILRKAAASQE